MFSVDVEGLVEEIGFQPSSELSSNCSLVILQKWDHEWIQPVESFGLCSCYTVQKISPDTKDKVQLQVVLQQGGANSFHFANPAGRAKQTEERDSVKELLQQLLPRFRRKVNADLEEKNRWVRDIVMCDHGVNINVEALPPIGCQFVGWCLMSHKAMLTACSGHDQSLGHSLVKSPVRLKMLSAAPFGGVDALLSSYLEVAKL